MSDKAALLATLADVQEPPAPEQGTPILLVACVALMLAIALVVTWRWYRHRNHWRREALHALRQTHSSGQGDPLQEMAIVLRRIARLRSGEQTSQLHGQPWLEALDRCFDTQWFTQGDGKVFGHALYAPAASEPIDPRPLSRTLDRLIRKLPARPDRSASSTDLAAA